VKKIAETKEDLFEELTTELNNAGIQATVNRATGEIALDATVLFGGDSAEVTAEGKAFLDKFLKVYVSVVYSEKYEGFIEKTQIEGHTAPLATSTYESGLPLSEERAANVREYCLSAQVGVDTSALTGDLEAIGRSNSKPIYNNNGEVDMEASRRVSFRFIVDAEGVK
jgi:chemotaxis protein MotB